MRRTPTLLAAATLAATLTAAPVSLAAPAAPAAPAKASAATTQTATGHEVRDQLPLGIAEFVPAHCRPLPW